VNIDSINRSISEAERFIRAAKAAKVRIIRGEQEKYVPHVSKEFAACKRASMDLSRALTDLRQGR